MAAQFESVEEYLSSISPGDWEVWKNPGDKIIERRLRDHATQSEEQKISRIILAGRALENLMSLQTGKFAILIGRGVGVDMEIAHAIPFSPRAGEDNDIRDAIVATREELGKISRGQVQIMGVYKPHQDETKIAALLEKNLGLHLIMRQNTSVDGFKLQAFARNRHGLAYEVKAINIF